MVIAAVDLSFVDAIASSESKRCPAIDSPAYEMYGVNDVIFAVASKSFELLLGARINDSRRTIGLAVIVDKIVLHMVRDRVAIDVAILARTYSRSVDHCNVW